MALSKVSQLNIESWSCDNRLIQAYRGYADKGQTATKKQLALAATIHTAKTVAWGVLSVGNLVVTLLTLGNVKNSSWHNALLNGQFAKVAFYALSHFKEAMEQMRVAEAQSHCRSALGMESLDLVPASSTTSWTADSLVKKLKGLNETQLKEALDFPISAHHDLLGGFLASLIRFRNEVATAKPVVDVKISQIQKMIYETKKELTGYCGAEVTFVTAEAREALEAYSTGFTDQLKKVEEKGGAEALVLTKEQFDICQFLSESHSQTVPSPTTLLDLATSWKKGRRRLRRRPPFIHRGCLKRRFLIQMQRLARWNNWPRSSKFRPWNGSVSTSRQNRL